MRGINRSTDGGTCVQNAHGEFTKHFIKPFHLTDADNICEVQ